MRGALEVCREWKRRMIDVVKKVSAVLCMQELFVERSITGPPADGCAVSTGQAPRRRRARASARVGCRVSMGAAALSPCRLVCAAPPPLRHCDTSTLSVPPLRPVSVATTAVYPSVLLSCVCVRASVSTRRCYLFGRLASSGSASCTNHIEPTTDRIASWSLQHRARPPCPIHRILSIFAPTSFH